MSISRRKFLGTGTVAALTAGLPLKTLAKEIMNQPGSESAAFLPNEVRSQVSRLNSAAFKRCLNTKFRVHPRSGSARVLELIEVSHWHSQPSQPTDRECFSTIFTGSTRDRLRQDTYTVEHESLGSFQMLLVPIGKKDQESRYEAVFNRLH